MSLLSPLLAIQDLDLSADAAHQRSEQLPERASLPRVEAELVEIERRLAAALAEQNQLQAEEAELGNGVSELARQIETAELERYSGKRKGRDEAVAHEESQRLLRERKESLETRELELLESLEAVEGRIEDERSKRAAHRAQATHLEVAIQKVEAEVALELERLDTERAALTPQLPADVLSVYDRIRAQPRSAGRGAALLDEGRCAACRIKLPSHEKTKMLALPEDALIQCPQCRRLLIR